MSAITTNNPLAALAAQNNVTENVALEVIDALSPFVSQAGEIARAAEAINVTDATQVSEIRKARTLRLQIKACRVEADKARKGLKETSLKRSQFIDAAGRHVAALIEPVEERLTAMEEFAERAEAARKAALKTEREAQLKPFGVDTSFYQLGDMPEAQFIQLLESTRLAHDAKIAAAKKVEEDRIAAEKAREEEEQRIRDENVRLQREAQERETAARAERERLESEAAEQRRTAEEAAKKEREEAAERLRVAEETARKEREAIEANARAEREAAEATARSEREAIEARAKVEREAAEAEARREREARQRLEAEAEERARVVRELADAERAAAHAAAIAPDKDKLIAWANELQIKPPSLDNATAESIAGRAWDDLMVITARVRNLAASL